MKLSVEGKVAASVAAAFVGLTVGVIAQGNNGEQSAGANGYGTTTNPEVSTHITQHGYNNSVTGRTNAEKNRQGTQWQRRH